MADHKAMIMASVHVKGVGTGVVLKDEIVSIIIQQNS